MNVTDPVAAPVAAPATAVRDTSKTATISSDFNVFLKMLTAQARNQDPLDPMDTAQFSTQLATFASVEQQTITNDLLRGMQSGSVGGLLGMVGLLGKTVEVAGAGTLQDTGLTFRYDADDTAAQRTLVIRNAFGTEIARAAIGPDAGTFTWSGIASSGTNAPPGEYSATIESVSPLGTAGSSPANVLAPVFELRQGTDGLDVVLGGGRTVAQSEIRAVLQ